MYRLQRLLRVGKSPFNLGRPLVHLREFCAGMERSSLELEKKEFINAENRSVEAVNHELYADVLRTFEELGLNYHAATALAENRIERPTAIQSAAIPIIVNHKDVVVRAKTGSGKTLAYLVSMAENLNGFVDPDSFPIKDIVPFAMIILPTLELCQQTADQLDPLLDGFFLDLHVTLLPRDALRPRGFYIVVSTPDCLVSCLTKQSLKTESPVRRLLLVILDEVDLLLSNGCEGDLKSILAHVPRSCQCLVFSSNPSADVEQLRRFCIRNPYIVTLPEVGDVRVEIAPYNIEQFYITCDSRNKLGHFLFLLDSYVLRGKVVIFTNSISMSRKLKEYVRMYPFRVRAGVIDPELSDHCCLRILEDFNAGRIDQLIIATPKQQDLLDWEAGVVAGINSNNVNFVLNFDMPETAAGYAHRVDRTGPPNKMAKAFSLVSPEEMCIFEEIKSSLGDDESKFIAPYKRISKDVVKNRLCMLGMSGAAETET